MEHQSRLSRAIRTAWGLQEELDQSANVSSGDSGEDRIVLAARGSVIIGEPVMQAPLKTWLAILAGGLALFLAVALGGEALAQDNCGCTPPPPPPSHCCHSGGGGKTVNINISAALVVNAQTNSSAQSSSNAAVLVNGGGGGGSSFSSGPGTSSLIQNLNVEGGQGRSAYEATRTTLKKVVIQAVCIDDKDVPHPASQVTPDRDIEDAYDNELYRCIAGTRMQATIADYNGQIDFSHGETLACHKGDALYHSPGGHVECRVQRPARDCNERSLLRRFGAGVKVLTMIVVEKYTAFHEESQSSGGALSLDGGVGGVVY